MNKIKNMLREPLLHFMLIGAGLFLIFGLTQEKSSSAPNRIVVGAGQVEQLYAQFEQTWMRSPTEKELANLVKTYVRDEVYYLEALAMGLDQNDPLIRRRMRQKLEFILEDLTAVEADEESLIAFLKQHPEKFRVEPRVSFSQLYLNPDKHQDFEANAKNILESLDKGTAPESLGDPTMLQYEYKLVTQSEIARWFGEEFSIDVVGLKPGVWNGPVFSRIGFHLVLIANQVAGRLPELEEVRDQVEQEYLHQRQQELKEMAYQKLLEGYEVDIVPLSTAVTRQAGNKGEAIALIPTGEAGQ